MSDEATSRRTGGKPLPGTESLPFHGKYPEAARLLRSKEDAAGAPKYSPLKCDPFGKDLLMKRVRGVRGAGA